MNGERGLAVGRGRGLSAGVGIYRILSRRYARPFHTPVRIAHGPWTEREGVLVRLADEAGRVGFGEASPIAWFGTGTAEEAAERVAGMGEWVEENAVTAVIAEGGPVGFALATAWADLRGEGVGAGGHESLPVAALLPAGRGVLAALDGLLDAGFRTFKWKVGVGEEADEMALLDDVLGKLPESAKLRLDANGAWSTRVATRWLERAAERPIEFIEQPIAAEARGAEDALRGLAGDFPTVIGLDESLATAGDVAKWRGLGWSGVWVVKPALLGDPARVAAELRAARADVVFSSALETAVGMKAALRMAFGWTEGRRALGFGVGPLFKERALNGPAPAPFLRREDVERINGEAAWNAVN